jgi:hypothetical protein
MTALAGIMENEQDQPNKSDRRYISRYLLVLANDPEYEKALIALAANGGDGKIECIYKNGRLINIDLKLRFK